MEDGRSDDTAIQAPSSDALPAASGERFGLERELGKGGMGAVYLYLDRRIGRRVAVKTLQPEIAKSPHARARFLREACVQGQLEHPSVVPVYDIGGVRVPEREGEGEPPLTFTMKRVRGVTLDEILRRQREGAADFDESRFGLRRLLEAFASVCLAIDFAHRRGVLHRDLKPANVMLGDFGEVYVLDWGLARLTDGEVSASDGERVVSTDGAGSAPTIDGAVLGTPGYMSPEQARGELDAVTAASDVYALGAILFELVSGEPLHLGSRIPALIASTLAGADARVSARVPSAAVAPELEAICVRATSTEPADRHESARELERAVRSYLDGERDETRRKELAAAHVEAARSAVRAAVEGDARVDARRDAMQAIGKALALDPESAGAMEALVELLSTPPRTMPPEVQFDIEDSVRRRTRWVGKVGVLAYASSFLYLPFLFWAGIRSVPPLFWFFGSMAACAALSAWVGWSKRPSPRVVLLGMLASNVAIAATGAFYGPLVVTAPVLIANTVAYAVHFEGRDRLLAIGAGALTWFVALGLWLGGLVPGGHRFEPDGLLIVAGAVEMAELPTLSLLSVLGVGVLVMSSVTVSRLRDDLSRAERQLLLYAWHLREIVPASVRTATDPTAKRRERTSLRPLS